MAHDEAEFDAVKRRNVAVSIADESMSSWASSWNRSKVQASESP